MTGIRPSPRDHRDLALTNSRLYLPIMTITLAQLESHLWEFANILRGIEQANPQTLYGIFGDAQWTNPNASLKVVPKLPVRLAPV